MPEEKHHHRHHREHISKKDRMKKWFKKNWKIAFIVLILLMFLIGMLIDRRIKNVEDQNVEVISVENNYDAIITIVDGEGELTFTKVWGELIREGYPICSDLVIDYVGKDGYMDWNTIEALNNIGVEFVFHSSNHVMYNTVSKEDVIYDIERGIQIMEEHGLEHRMITWLSSSNKEVCELGKKYFDGGITDSPSVSTLDGNKTNPMMIGDIFGSSDTSYFTYQQLLTLIEQARANNGWVVLFTRNNHKMMDSTQIEIYRQAFEYAKEHNVAVVTASEGYDLYYGNKLGNK